jgi:hypothetical protein
MQGRAILRRWFRTHLGERALDAGRRDLVRFNAGLAESSDADLGALIAVATVLRINFETHEVIPPGVFTDEEMPSAETLGAGQLRINKLIHQFNRAGKPDDAAGATVWSYSLRALNVPGLRDPGREMWAELRRGFGHVEAALADGEAQRGEPFPRRVWQEWDMIPAGLEPFAKEPEG